MSFTIEMLPAREGDCLWIEYGDQTHPHRVLIDGGSFGTDRDVIERIKKVPGGHVHFELMVITHVDVDHIQGILNLLEKKDRPFTVGDVWFNGWPHLDESDVFETFGPVEGEKLTDILRLHEYQWNRAFTPNGHHPRAVVVPEDGPLPQKALEGGMTLTLLSPSRPKLLELRPKWEEECRKAGLDPKHEATFEQIPSGVEAYGPLDIESLAESRSDPDQSEANGSSIAFVTEFNGKRALLGGDAHPDLLLSSLRRMLGKPRGRLRVDVLKLPHHGSRANINREILETLDCNRYLISTNGARYRHPNAESIARIIKFGGDRPELIFNYRSDQSRIWNNDDWMDRYGYTARYVCDSADIGKVSL